MNRINWKLLGGGFHESNKHVQTILNIYQIIFILRPHLTSTEAEKRCRGTELLSKILAQLPLSHINAKEGLCLLLIIDSSKNKVWKNRKNTLHKKCYRYFDILFHSFSHVHFLSTLNIRCISYIKHVSCIHKCTCSWISLTLNNVSLHYENEMNNIYCDFQWRCWQVSCVTVWRITTLCCPTCSRPCMLW